MFELDGTWKLITQEVGGKQLPQSSIEGYQLVINDESYVFRGEKTDKGTISYANGTLDLQGEEGPNQGNKITAIYKLDGSSLIICYNLLGTEYPIDFESKAAPHLSIGVFEKQN